MITARLVGQAGNQMHTYVVAKILAERTGLAYFPPEFFLTKSGEPVRWHDDEPLLRMTPTDGRVLSGEPQVINTAHWFDLSRITGEQPVHIKFGYFQRYEMFKAYKQQIRGNWLRLRKPFYAADPDAVVVHVRRTDYVPTASNELNKATQGYFTDIDEYRMCLERIPEAKRLVLVSDAPGDGFLREFQRFGLPVDISSGAWDEDFLALASARWVILSQSTFSWWAAFLGRAERIVCAVRPGSLWHNGIADKQLPHLFVDDEPGRWIWITE